MASLDSIITVEIAPETIQAIRDLQKSVDRLAELLEEEEDESTVSFNFRGPEPLPYTRECDDPECRCHAYFASKRQEVSELSRSTQSPEPARSS